MGAILVPNAVNLLKKRGNPRFWRREKNGTRSRAKKELLSLKEIKGNETIKKRIDNLLGGDQ